MKQSAPEDPAVAPTTGAELRTLWRQAIEEDTPDDIARLQAEFEAGRATYAQAVKSRKRDEPLPWPPVPPDMHRSARTRALREQAMDAYAAFLLPQLHRGDVALRGAKP